MDKVKTLKKNREFSFLYRKGKTLVTPVVVIYYHKNKRENIRYGITTGKKIGNAVKRNRARRILRSAFLQIVPDIKGNYDFVLVARGKTPFVKSGDIKRAIVKQFKDNKLI